MREPSPHSPQGSPPGRTPGCGRRGLLSGGAAGGLALLAGGCGSEGSVFDPSGPTVGAVRDALFGAPASARLSRAYVDSRPFAFVVAQFAGSPPALVALASIEGEDLSWLTGRRELIRTRHGRVVQTAGLSENLRESHELGPDPLAANAARAATAESRRMITIEAGGAMAAMIVESRFEVKQAEPVTILEREHRTVLVVEQGTAQAVRPWRFENRYWIDPGNGFVWRTVQQVTPNLPVLTIEVATPAPVGPFAPRRSG